VRPVTASGKTSPTTAPKPATWAWAEDFVPEPEAVTAARESATTLGATPVGRGAAATLTFLARAVQARAVVEIGTGAGVSGLALFAGMQPEGILTSVDTEPQAQQAARKAFVAQGIPTQRFRLISGNALDVLPRLSDGAYDLVLVDGDPMEYPEYVEQGIRLLRHGGLIAIDHALLSNRTADAAQTDEETESVRAALELIRDHEDLVTTLLPVGDGLLVAAKR
jgi:predicted O-methyltransferase YrrM